jgi:cell division topological specificity factor
MLEFITKFFRREEASKTLAKERLRLVLMSDRVSLAPDVFDEMKDEMLAVIRRYLEIDERALDMHFENLERQFALLASIPVLKVKTVEQGGAWRRQTAVVQANGAAGASSGTLPAGDAAIDNVRALTKGGPQNGAATTPPPRRRRRRRRTAAPPQSDALPPVEPKDSSEGEPRSEQ